MSKHRKNNEKRKKPDTKSAFAGVSTKRKRSKGDQNQSQVPVTAVTQAATTGPFDDDPTVKNGHKARVSKSHMVAASIRKEKAKKKAKDKKQRHENNDNEGDDRVDKSNNFIKREKGSPSFKNSSRPSSKKKKSSKNANKKGFKQVDDESKKTKIDQPTPPVKAKMGIDEQRICSEMRNKNEEGDDRSTLDKLAQMDGRIAWVQSVYGKKLKGIIKEFSKAKGYLPTITVNVYSAHEQQNRYADVLCADETRVVLRNREPNNDYIHASWLAAPILGSQRYICAQGPMENCILDFWQMIWQEGVTVIVMLCDVIENGFEKCSQYWPAGVGETAQYGNFKLKNEKIEATDIGTIKCTTIKVEETEENNIHMVLHYQWADWPDHVSPAEPGPATELIKVTKEKSKGSPIVVHCSAGIGRTGTYCGIDYANEKLRTDAKIQMPEIIYELRRQRVHSVQSNPQYVYIHLCLLYLLVETKVVPETEDTKQFFADYKKYMDAIRRKFEKKHQQRKFDKEKELVVAEKEKEKEDASE